MQKPKRKLNFKLSIDNLEIKDFIIISTQLYTQNQSLPLPTIQIPNTEIALIKNTINLSIYQEQLIKLHNLLSNSSQNNLYFYTDVSIYYSQTSSIKSGISWILSNNNQIKFNASLTYTSNLMRAEIEAIISILLILPIFSHVYIHIDNLLALQTLKNLPYNNYTQIKQLN